MSPSLARRLAAKEAERRRLQEQFKKRMEAKYVLTAHGYQGPIEKALGQKDSRLGVYDDADLQRRLAAAKKAGVKVSVKKL